jgi:virginiamycin B lyase
MGGPHAGSTHELAFVPVPGGAKGKAYEVIVSGQNYDSLARVGMDGSVRFVAMPAGSRPHGLGLDAGGLLWATLEYTGRVVAFAPDGRRVRDVDVRLDCSACPEPINSHPHGLGLADDGRTVWVTGKATGTVSRIAADGTVATWALPTVGSLPIYIRAGPDPLAPRVGPGRETMWVTELTGNAIAAVSVTRTAPGRPPHATVREYTIPTPNSRPIAVERGPDGRMWFSEEAGGKVGRVETDGRIVEFALPSPPGRPPLLLAALAFDRDGNLWVQQYVDHNHPDPATADRLMRIASAALAGPPGPFPAAALTCFPVPTRDTVMHRIAPGPDGMLWFTELNADRLGRLDPRAQGSAC